MITRRFIIKCSSQDICIEMLNRITEEINARWLKTQVKGNVLSIEVLGLPYELKSLRHELEELKRCMELKRMKGGRYRLTDLVKSAKTTVPLDALLYALKLLGYKAMREEDYTVSDAPGEVIINLMKKMTEVLDNEIVRFKLPHSAKKVVMIVHAIYNMPPGRVVELMVEDGILEEREFKYVLRYKWEEVLRRLVKLLAKGSWG